MPEPASCPEPTLPARTAQQHYVSMLLHEVPGALWATDASLRITYARGRVLALADLDARETIGMAVQDFVGSSDPTEPALARHRAALAGERQSFRYEFRERTFEVSIHPLRGERDEVIGCVGAAVDVTEQRRTEEDLERSRRSLEEAQKVAHVGSFEWDIARRTVLWSDEMHRIYGLAPGEFGGTYDAFVALVHPDDLESTERAVRDAVALGGPIDYDHRIVRADGTVRVLRTRGELLRDEVGRPLRLVGSCWDVTELQRATEELRRTVSLQRAIIEATADGILAVDLEGRVVACNAQLARLWGMRDALADVRREAAMIAFMAGQLASADPLLERVRALAARPDVESFDVLRLADGRVLECASRPQRLDGVVVGRVWSFRDVSERERVVRSTTLLSDATRLLSSLDVEAALEGVAKLIVANLADTCAVDLVDGGGPRRLLAVGRDPSITPLPELQPSVLGGHAALYDVGTTSCLAVPLLTREAVVGAITLVAPPGRRYQREELALVEELAQRASLSLENARLYRAAKEALEAREEFLGIAAHELRGPLTAIHIAAQSLAKGGLREPQRTRFLEVLTREDRRLGRFVDELMDLGRMRGGLHFTFETVDLAEVVRDAAARLSHELGRSGSSLSIETESGTVGSWDRFRVEQVAGNLLGNAVKFGLGRPIRVTVRPDGPNVVLEVIDHGIGIPESNRERIFHPFERGVSARHYGGLGLGLHIVRTIVEGLGGSVHVESAPGAGSRFVVTLPREQRTHADA